MILQLSGQRMGDINDIPNERVLPLIYTRRPP